MPVTSRKIHQVKLTRKDSCSVIIQGNKVAGDELGRTEGAIQKIRTKSEYKQAEQRVRMREERVAERLVVEQNEIVELSEEIEHRENSNEMGVVRTEEQSNGNNEQSI